MATSIPDPHYTRSGIAAPSARVWLALAATLVLGAALRLYHLGHEAFWADEWYTWFAATSADTDALLDFLLSDPHPPGYQLLTYTVAALLGDEAWALRLPSALAGIVSIAVMFQLGRDLYDDTTGLIAALLTAVLWCPLDISQDARAYGLMVLFTQLTVLASIRLARMLLADRPVRARYLVGFTSAAVVLCYLHYYGLIIVLLCWASLAAVACRRRAWGPVVITGLAILISYVPWATHLFGHLAVAEFWIARPALPLTAVSRLVEFQLSESWIVTSVTLLVVGAAFGLRTFRRAYAIPSAMPHVGVSDGIVLAWLLSPMFVAYVQSTLMFPTLNEKNLLVTMPALILLVARCMRSLRAAPFVPIVVACGFSLVALVDLVSISGYYSLPQKPPFNQAARDLATRIAESDDTVLLSYAAAQQAFDYHLERTGSATRVRSAIQSAAHLDEVLSGLDRSGAPPARITLAWTSGMDYATDKNALAVHVFARHGYLLSELVEHDAADRSEYLRVGWHTFARRQVAPATAEALPPPPVGPERVDFTALERPFPDGTRWNAPGTFIVDERGLLVDLVAPRRAGSLEIGLDNNDLYELRYLQQGRTLAMTRVSPASGDGLAVTRVDVPSAASRVGYDGIWVLPIAGDGAYSIGHLRLIW